MNNRMKILITGAGGFLGKRLTQRLAANGHEVIAAMRADPPTEDGHYFASGKVRMLKLDLSRLEDEQLPAGVDVVYSIAQSSHFRHFPEKAGDIFSVNVTANMKLLQWAMDRGIKRYIFASSGGVYGGRSGQEWR